MQTPASRTSGADAAPSVSGVAIAIATMTDEMPIRLRITSARLGRSIDLDPLELETLTWQSHDLFTGFLAEPFGPEDEQ